MKIAVIGCGYWGAKHARVMYGLDAVEEVGLVDHDPEITARLAQAYPGVRVFDSYEHALEEVDAVVIATPPTTHAPLARQALLADRHVLVEKPLCTDSVDGRMLIELAASRDRALMVGHTFEYNNAVHALRSLVGSGELGDIHYIDTARLNLGLYQPDVNVVWDLAPHDISIVNHVLDARPSRVMAWGEAHAHTDLEDVAYLRLEYDQPQVTAQIHVSWLDPCKVRRVTLVGSSKMAVYNDLSADERLRIYDKGVAFGLNDGSDLSRMPVSYRVGGIESPFVPFDEPLLIEDRHFVECVATGTRPLTDGECGLAVVEVLEAAGQSMRTGMPVDLRSAIESPAQANGIAVA